MEHSKMLKLLVVKYCYRIALGKEHSMKAPRCLSLLCLDMKRFVVNFTNSID